MDGKMKQAYQQLKSENETLLRILETQEELAQIIMHDMKNPLFAIEGSLQMMRMMADAGQPIDSKKLLARMERGCRGLLRMITALTDLHLLEKGELPIHPSPVDLTQLIKELIDYFQTQDIHHEKHADCHFPPNLPLIFVDRTLCERTLEILLNYVYANAENEFPIIIDCQLQARQNVHLKITHAGIDIPEAFHEKIFQKSAQNELKEAGFNSARALGLVYCKQALKANGGDIMFIPTEKAFRLTFPLPK